METAPSSCSKGHPTRPSACASAPHHLDDRASAMRSCLTIQSSVFSRRSTCSSYAAALASKVVFMASRSILSRSSTPETMPPLKSTRMQRSLRRELKSLRRAWKTWTGMGHSKSAASPGMWYRCRSAKTSRHEVEHHKLAWVGIWRSGLISPRPLPANPVPSSRDAGEPQESAKNPGCLRGGSS